MSSECKLQVVRLASVSDDSSAKTKDSGFFVAIGKALSALQRKLTRTEEDAAKAATQHMIEVQHASEQAQLDFEKKLNEQEPH